MHNDSPHQTQIIKKGTTEQLTFVYDCQEDTAAELCIE